MNDRAETDGEEPGQSTIDRRFFVGLAAGGVGGAALIAVPAVAAWPTDSVAAGSGGDMEHAQGSDSGATTTEATVSYQEMDAMHKEGVDLFLKNITEPITEGLGCQEYTGEMEGDTRVFRLTCSEVDWEVTPGQVEKAMAYNGTVPGPTLRMKEGEKTRVILTNELQESTAIHWHGQFVPNDQDGVPFITQDPVTPGSTYTYEFIPNPAGSSMYHSHHNAAVQVGSGLLGALIVEPADPAAEPEHDLDYVYIFNDALGGFTINGKGFPATSAYTAKLGQRVRFRFMNEGNMAHPVHLHGMNFEVFARDGFMLPQPYKCDVINVAPGERWDATVVADNPGLWAFHCHILTHAESAHGMFGMVTVFVVEED